MTRRVRPRAFTLIEVLIVLVILGIVTAATVPALATLGSPKHPLESASSRLVTLLSKARRAAMDRGVPVMLTLDVARRPSYRAMAETDQGLETIAEGSLELPEGVELFAPYGGLRFRFDPVGTGWGPSLPLRGPGGTAVIEVDPWTGEPRVVR